MTGKFAPIAKLCVCGMVVGACFGCASKRQPVAASPAVAQSASAHSPYTSYAASSKPSESIADPGVVVASGLSATSLPDTQPATPSYPTQSGAVSNQEETPFFRASGCGTPGCGGCKR